MESFERTNLKLFNSIKKKRTYKYVHEAAPFGLVGNASQNMLSAPAPALPMRLFLGFVIQKIEGSCLFYYLSKKSKSNCVTWEHSFILGFDCIDSKIVNEPKSKMGEL